jgi:HAD superfamily hydrolase (TIGR01458 family)
MIHGVLFDLGGVLYVGNRPLRGAYEALVSLRAAGIPVRFVTNITRLSRHGIVAKLAHMGLEISERDLLTPAVAAREYLLAHQLIPHLLVHPNLQPEFVDLTGSTPNAVLIGDAGDSFTYAALNTAFRTLADGAPLLALGKNRYFEEPGGLSLDAGPFVAALEYAASISAVVLGKPSADFFLSAVRSLGLPASDVAMVGDDADSDVAGAIAAGLQAILVKSGKYRPGDEARVITQGAHCLEDIDQAVDFIL